VETPKQQKTGNSSEKPRFSVSRVRCFLLEPTGNTRISLRRYSRHDRNTPDCCPRYPGKYSYHTVQNFIFDEPIEYDNEDSITNGVKSAPSHDDPRWPKQCHCGYSFQDDDHWQRFAEQLYRRSDTGEIMTIAEAPVGALWYAPHYDHIYTPQGEHCLMCKTPGGEWCIDSQASNCTIPDDRRQERHHCWVLTGLPPDVTAGKGGPTCSAGAGSIQCGSYHGFLRNGYLEE
jgi:hypothetical protein